MRSTSAEVVTILHAPRDFFDNAQPPLEGERFDTLLRHRQLHIERIVSSSRIVPQTYVQTQDEWVMLVQGEALLDVDGREVPLKTGDHLFIPAGTPHTVKRTQDGTVWLAVHLHPEEAS